MPNRAVIKTDRAPAAAGTYSQAVKVDNTVYLSGQIALDPETQQMISGGFSDEVHQVFRNLSAVCEASDGSLQHIVKLNLYITDSSNFAAVNEIMAEFFEEPYPARATVVVKELPRGALFEAEAIMVT
ncbi:Rid family detoxifying hydrolase [Microbulbifer sp. EKSA008]|uniref:Rid family detoxifying hydrolase n=1 Tax=unclassified Microbulbifer TaxID=2619833 RepID=UPI0024AE3535|nr:Rid family detoxifying hydrolase [Microbulbifer sp. VAAF005]WHI44914.1 Rid family detoxifying hydrolase [Microbulbifer sp. VAAF005]WNZ56314.1 Rid family detoxifying hydrolase [Microbulbifer sp. MKSA007]